MKNQQSSLLKCCKKNLALFLVIVFIQACSPKHKKTPTAQEKPNIVLINIDDMGWMDTSFMGNNFYETPVIDALAKQGMIFTNGYAAAANCAPSRASLMTGKWPQRHGIITVGSSERGKTADRKLIPIKNTTTISKGFTLLPQVLQKNGYVTCHAGKWHLSTNPLENGFTTNIGGSHAGHPSSYYPPYKNVALKAAKGKRLTDVVMDQTIAFIKAHKNQPFFINYAPYAVHTPIQAVPDLVDKYKEKKGIIGSSNINYATMIQNLDENIGRLITVLKKTKTFNNTLIVFTSDNGGLFSVSNQHPLRAGKGSYYEGGIRVPFFFVWKGKIKPNQTNQTPIANLDIFPTLINIAGVATNTSLALDGKNIAPVLLTNTQLKTRPLFWHFPVYLQSVMAINENRDPKFRTRPGSAIRYGDYKLHHYFEDNALELYNLKKDLGEKENLAFKEKEKAAELFTLLKVWRSNTNASIPTQLNPDYNPNN